MNVVNSLCLFFHHHHCVAYHICSFSLFRMPHIIWLGHTPRSDLFTNEMLNNQSHQPPSEVFIISTVTAMDTLHTYTQIYYIYLYICVCPIINANDNFNVGLDNISTCILYINLKSSYSHISIPFGSDTHTDWQYVFVIDDKVVLSPSSSSSSGIHDVHDSKPSSIHGYTTVGTTDNCCCLITFQNGFVSCSSSFIHILALFFPLLLSF